MSSVPGKYIKDENGNIFSPIVSSDSVITKGGGNLTPSAITLVLGSDYDITTSSSWEEKRVPLNVVETNIGSCFSLNNNSVLVGDNVNAVRISGNLDMWQGPDTIAECILKLNVYRNNTITKGKEINSSKNGSLVGLSLTPFIVQVQKGDKIEMIATIGIAGTIKLMGRNKNTYLTVEKIY